MSLTAQFIQNHARILAEPHSYEMGGETQLAKTMHGTSIIRHQQKPSGPFYSVAIGRPVGGYNGSLVGSDGPYVVTTINGLQMDRSMYAVRTTGSSKDEGVRCLPWTPDKATFTRLDTTTDRLFFTGPLQGCHIYVARQQGTWYVVHANYNADTAPAANIQAKHTLYELAQNFFDGMGVTDVGALLRPDYMPATQDAYNAFVYGVRTDTWRFYVHCSTHVNGTWRVHIASRQFA